MHSIAEDIGNIVIDYIIQAGLVDSDNKHPEVFVWTANAGEQVGHKVLDCFRKCRLSPKFHALAREAKENCVLQSELEGE